jgi:hypothetical protein
LNKKSNYGVRSHGSFRFALRWAKRKEARREEEEEGKEREEAAVEIAI